MILGTECVRIQDICAQGRRFCGRRYPFWHDERFGAQKEVVWKIFMPREENFLGDGTLLKESCVLGYGINWDSANQEGSNWDRANRERMLLICPVPDRSAPDLHCPR